MVAGTVRALGGEVGTDTTPGGGTTIWFTVPAAPAGAAGVTRSGSGMK
ncbi:hypothetical protein ACFHWS_27515 [Micromonospora sp. LOL_013]